MTSAVAPATAPAPTSKWTVELTLSDVYGSTLYDFFEKNSQDGVASLLDQIEIEKLTFTYTYEGPNTSKFETEGTIKLGKLPLELNFTHNPDDWTFEANLAFGESAVPSTTIGEIAGHIFGSEVQDELPFFVTDISIQPPRKKDAAGIRMKALGEKKKSDPKTPTDQPAVSASKPKTKKDIFFTAWVSFGGFSFQAFQYKAAPTEATPKPVAQRAFRIAVAAIPKVTIDLIGELPQPFDEMVFLYVQRQKGENAPLGLTYQDVEKINDGLPDDQKLMYKVTKKQSAQSAPSQLDTGVKPNEGDASGRAYQPTDVVIPAGLHFMLLRNDPQKGKSVALDYLFGGGKKTNPKSSTFETESEDTKPEPETKTDQAAAKAPYEKKVGPLTVNNLGLQYSLGKKPSLSLLLDASIVLGPIGVGLLGFKITLVFQKDDSDPSKTSTIFHNLPKPEFTIEGLAASFDRPPVILAGMFKHVTTSVQDTYQGAATISFAPYLFQAAGFYGKINIKTQKEPFTSAFVYFMLNGPLATFEFAEIRGVVGGFGYNNSLQFPTATNVLQFPLISPPGDQKPEDALKSLMEGTWFFPKNHSFWLAAGLTVLAFELLDVQAVVVVEWDPKVKIGLFGVATADMPPKVDKKFAHVQLGLTAVIDIDAGTFKVDGQLTPASYVLDPSCHLTGGFAFYTWFANDGSTSAGDFVFTIGGYHRSYKKPEQYPNPPRLAISWSYDSSISIRGEAYFAITPKVCMGGGRLDASLTLGALYAFFDAYADFLIKYKPFFFMADGGVSVGVRYTLDLWICTVHISIELSATLYIQGPPIAGRVHVNFWVFGFDVNFGSQVTHKNDPLTLEAFFQQVLQADLPKGNAEPPPPFIFSCNRGLIPVSETEASTEPNKTEWNVRGAVFQFTVACKFAVRQATVVTGQLDPGEGGPEYQFPDNSADLRPIHAKPMHLKGEDTLTSDLTVTIRPTGNPKVLTASEDDVGVPKWEKAELIYKSLPVALWGEYDERADPNSSSTRDDPNQIGSLLDNKDHSVKHITGICISSPLPALSINDKIKPFQYKKFFINTAGNKSYEFPRVPTVEKLWDPQDENTTPEAWENVRNQWNGEPKYGAGAGENFVDTWKKLSFAKWDTKPPANPAPDAPKVAPMTGKPPTYLLNDKVKFAKLFLEVPRMGMATA
ncbi:hypothetical protein NUU61_002369 [Penicillium alfredii]|uniref:DUF6603 domain-containing protein n=1 Tax=Penicillium alfredii TaxID=1506179 RepID=A0A9W9FS46_9EURO|nr:uncharacterized protein NUU61_002369 [Penicillium alfredii]KAJ5105022.1 hypothetical protein NUU61_002369 [Penicillium alfredii]